MDFERDPEIIKNKINDLKILGYDRIHIPGGTSVDGSYYSGCVIATYDHQSRKVYFLGVPYNSSFHLKGRSANKSLGETPESTIIREVFEETGLHLFNEDLKKIFERSVRDNRPGKSNEYHKKHFYLAVNFTGNLFDFPGPNPISGETASPLWIPAELFVKIVFGGYKQVIKLAIEDLMQLNLEFAYSLMNLEL